jgi:hypothetical protein
VLHLLNLEEIEALLLKVPGLVKRFEERDTDFFPAVKSWLGGVEDMLRKNGMPATSEIAVCRSSLISVERGFSDGAVLKSRMGIRNLKEARASQMLKRATEIITEAIRLRRGQVDEAGRVMMQIIAVAERLGLLADEAGQNHTAYLQSTLRKMSDRAEITSFVVHVTGLLGKADTLIVLDRYITRFRT